MIDLEQDALPSALVVDGEEHPVKTSFRVWMRWGRIAQEHDVCDPSIFVGEPPRGRWAEAAREFYRSECPTPHGTKRHERAFDMLMDSDYLVAAFQQAYGIDLTEGDMHWHRFLALWRGLPSDTRLAEIIGHRTWTKSRRSPDSVREELREQWSLPAEQDDELLAWQQEVFG